MFEMENIQVYYRGQGNASFAPVWCFLYVVVLLLTSVTIVVAPISAKKNLNWKCCCVLHVLSHVVSIGILVIFFQLTYIFIVGSQDFLEVCTLIVELSTLGSIPDLTMSCLIDTLQ